MPHLLGSLPPPSFPFVLPSFALAPFDPDISADTRSKHALELEHCRLLLPRLVVADQV